MEDDAFARKVQRTHQMVMYGPFHLVVYVDRLGLKVLSPRKAGGPYSGHAFEVWQIWTSNMHEADRHCDGLRLRQFGHLNLQTALCKFHN